MKETHKKIVSVRGITGRYLLVILLCAMAGVVATTGVGLYSTHQVVQQHEAIERDVLSNDFSELVAFYRRIAEALARRQQVHDILAFADQEQATLWAREIRALLPQSIGVALIDAEGEVLGEPLQLNLGEQCLSDMQQLLAGHPITQPPVHARVEALSHFDVVTPVSVSGEPLGLLFMSFSLDVLQRRVEQRLGGSDYLAVYDGDGRPIAVAGSLPKPGASLQPLPIPGTDWSLRYKGRGTSSATLVLLAVVVGGVIFTVTLLLVLFLSTRLVRTFSEDLSGIRTMLASVHAGEVLPTSQPRLSETSAIMGELAALATSIRDANLDLKEQSRRDALTGLLNRRGFDEALSRQVELAGRGEAAILVLLDLDLFKQVNDRYGHGVGDEVLQALAEALRERCRSSDLLARLGGDEFAVILLGDMEAQLDEWFRQLSERFQEKQAQLNGGEGIKAPCRVSAGAVPVVKKAGSSVNDLLESADRQLYQAKSSSRGVICHEKK